MSVLLEARSVSKAFGRTQALRGVSLGVEDKETLAITGRSGSGKSTLLLCLAGVLRPEVGQVSHGGRDLASMSEAERTRLRRREFGLVLQFGQLVPELSAIDNVALPLLMERHGRAASRRTALDWLERLGALDLADARPGELSGGEAQRIAVARALVSAPRIVFADEPTGALDTVSGERVLDALLSAARDCGAAVVLVTHDNRVAARADRELVLTDGQVDESISLGRSV